MLEVSGISQIDFMIQFQDIVKRLPLSRTSNL